MRRIWKQKSLKQITQKYSKNVNEKDLLTKANVDLSREWSEINTYGVQSRFETRLIALWFQ